MVCLGKAFSIKYARFIALNQFGIDFDSNRALLEHCFEYLGTWLSKGIVVQIGNDSLPLIFVNFALFIAPSANVWVCWSALDSVFIDVSITSQMITSIASVFMIESTVNHLLNWQIWSWLIVFNCVMGGYNTDSSLCPTITTCLSLHRWYLISPKLLLW